jgi:hypothetical protein
MYCSNIRLPASPPCCARATSGHPAAPPRRVIKSRRLMRLPPARDRSLPHDLVPNCLVHHSKFGGEWQGWVIHDRGGRCHTIVHVRFTPKADKWGQVSLSPLCANRVITRCSTLAPVSTAFLPLALGACGQAHREDRAIARLARHHEDPTPTHGYAETGWS